MKGSRIVALLVATCIMVLCSVAAYSLDGDSDKGIESSNSKGIESKLSLAAPTSATPTTVFSDWRNPELEPYKPLSQDGGVFDDDTAEDPTTYEQDSLSIDPIENAEEPQSPELMASLGSRKRGEVDLEDLGDATGLVDSESKKSEEVNLEVDSADNMNGLAVHSNPEVVSIVEPDSSEAHSSVRSCFQMMNPSFPSGAISNGDEAVQQLTPAQKMVRCLIMRALSRATASTPSKDIYEYTPTNDQSVLPLPSPSTETEQNDESNPTSTAGILPPSFGGKLEKKRLSLVKVMLLGSSASSSHGSPLPLGEENGKSPKVKLILVVKKTEYEAPKKVNEPSEETGCNSSACGKDDEDAAGVILFLVIILFFIVTFAAGMLYDSCLWIRVGQALSQKSVQVQTKAFKCNVGKPSAIRVTMQAPIVGGVDKKPKPAAGSNEKGILIA